MEIKIEKEIKEDMEIKKEKENYVLSAVTRNYYSDDISGICRFIEYKEDKEDEDKEYEDNEDKDNEDEDKDDKKPLMSKIWPRKKKEEKDKDDTELKRFIILNFHGIYNLEFDNNFVESQENASDAANKYQKVSNYNNFI